jgi:hypothetical protein
VLSASGLFLQKMCLWIFCGSIWLHPVVSGNKWFKLKYYLDDALAQQGK